MFLLTCAKASIQVPISLLVTWDITKLIVFAVSAVFINLGPGDGGRALKIKKRRNHGLHCLQNLTTIFIIF